MSLSYPRRSFSSLSVRDLLDAREAYHTHLVHLENVIGTAIGRYRFYHDDEVSPDGKEPPPRSPRGHAEPKTFANSELRHYSWPCVMVFVDRWLPPAEFATKVDEVVPPRLYLPDGRVVPTCVLYARPAPSPNDDAMVNRYPSNLLGGGYPALAEVQEQSRVATISCLVSDGDYYYALTNAHVAGGAERKLFTLVDGHREELGSVDPARRVSSIPFERAFPGLPGPRSVSTVDAALVRVNDATRWTSQVYRIGEFGMPVDLNADSISLDLISSDVVAEGAVSGEMRGTIQALFYRYYSIGGQDQLADLLIGPSRDRDASALAAHGNSGALWFLELDSEDKKSKVRRPIGLHWGGQRFAAGGTTSATPLALATSLSVALRELGVDIVRDQNIGLPTTWGKTGHYKVAQLACTAIDFEIPSLTKLFGANVERISFSAAISKDSASPSADDAFIPLADVPDIVWKRGGQSQRGNENPNHFADMDQPSPEFGGKTLLELGEDPAYLDPEKWHAFYTSVNVDLKHNGTLPFRVWQLFDEMVAAIKKKDLAHYVAAAGVLAHYVGDACQPLHVSMYHHGHPDKPDEDGVHEQYETKMLDKYAPQINSKVDALLAATPAKTTAAVTSGLEAARAVVALMTNAINAVPPLDIVAAFNQGGNRNDVLFTKFGDSTAKLLIKGAAVLASVWRGAWTAGGGDASFGPGQMKEIAQSALSALYLDKAFAKSVLITAMKRVGDTLQIS